METTRMSVYLPNLRSSSVICMASSLVGARISPWMVRSGFMSCSMDTEYAAVLPDPVWACPTTSLPESSTGMAASCMGNVSSNSISSRAFRISSLIPNSLNFVIFHFFSCDDNNSAPLCHHSDGGPPLNIQYKRLLPGEDRGVAHAGLSAMHTNP